MLLSVINHILHFLTPSYTFFSSRVHSYNYDNTTVSAASASAVILHSWEVKEGLRVNFHTFRAAFRSAAACWPVYRWGCPDPTGSHLLDCPPPRGCGGPRRGAAVRPLSFQSQSSTLLFCLSSRVQTARNCPQPAGIQLLGKKFHHWTTISLSLPTPAHTKTGTIHFQYIWSKLSGFISKIPFKTLTALLNKTVPHLTSCALKKSDSSRTSRNCFNCLR